MPVILGSGQNSVNFYTDYKIDREVNIKQGVLIIPVAGPPGTPPKVVRTYAPYMEKRSEWATEKIGNKPTVPHWDTGDPNTIPVEMHFFPMSPMPIDEFRQAWRMEGVYRYVYAVAPLLSGLSMEAGAITPAATPKPEDNVITIDLFTKDQLKEAVKKEPTISKDLLSGIVG